MLWFKVTAEPFNNKVPADGRAVMMTALNVLAGLSEASAKPKSDAANVLLLFSSRVMVELVPVGASLTGDTAMFKDNCSLNTVEIKELPMSMALPLVRVAAELSTKRRDKAPGVPLKSDAGLNRSLASGPKYQAMLLLTAGRSNH